MCPVGGMIISLSVLEWQILSTLKGLVKKLSFSKIGMPVFSTQTTCTVLLCPDIGTDVSPVATVHSFSVRLS